MATKCPYCDSTAFESVILPLQSTGGEVDVVRCSSCKKAIGIDNTEQIKDLVEMLLDEIEE